MQKVLEDRARLHQLHQWNQTSGQETGSDIPEPLGFWSQPEILLWRCSSSGSGSSSTCRSTGSNMTHQKTASPRRTEGSLEGERSHGRAFKQPQSTISDYFFQFSMFLPCYPEEKCYFYTELKDLTPPELQDFVSLRLLRCFSSGKHAEWKQSACSLFFLELTRGVKVVECQAGFLTAGWRNSSWIVSWADGWSGFSWD